MRWAGHMARMAKKRGAKRVLVRERDYLLDLVLDGKIILVEFFNK